MAFCVHKVKKLPATLDPDGIYLVQLKGTELVEYYVASDTGNPHRVDGSDSLGWHRAGENLNGRRLVCFEGNGNVRLCQPENGDIADGFIRSAAMRGKEVEVFASGICPGMGGLNTGRPTA